MCMSLKSQHWGVRGASLGATGQQPNHWETLSKRSGLHSWGWHPVLSSGLHLWALKKMRDYVLNSWVECIPQLAQGSQVFQLCILQVWDTWFHVSGFHLNKDTWSFSETVSAFSRQEAMHVPLPCFSPLLSSSRFTSPSMPDSTAIILILSVPSLFKLFSVLWDFRYFYYR